MTGAVRPHGGARAELLARLRRDGVLWEGPDQPIVDRNGDSAPWMFYSWNVTLTAGGADAAARALLERLDGFTSTQLATFGTTGIPLVAACVLLGGGKYTGLCVREQPKGHAGGRQIEGPADRSRPVVIVDDSLSSGTSLLRGIAVLERQGFVVEGGIALVHFPHRGGRERAQALGYRVETLFDVWDDLGMQRPVHVPGFMRAGTFEHTASALADGLHPARAAREAAEQLLTCGTLPAPPRAFDAEYDARGGVWVSFRDRRTDVRVARDGFWHFDPRDADPCRDVVLAAAKTVRSGELRAEDLPHLKVGVTFFGELEPIEPVGLDFARYGIVVRSTAWPVKVGGALPNTQVFTSEFEQFRLARRNAGLGAFEPYELFRHTVFKCVEPGETWLPYGAPDGPEYAWVRDVAIGEALTARARAVAAAAARDEPAPAGALPGDLVPLHVAAVSVTLYRVGIAGCCVSSRRDLDAAVVAAAQGAVADARFGVVGPDVVDAASVSVSVLYDPERIGWTSLQRAASKVRLGRDSLSIQQGEHSAFFLESVGPHYDWTKDELARRLARKAGASDGDADWTTYRTTTWLSTGTEPVALDFGFAPPPAGPCDDAALRDDLGLIGGFIDANLLPSGFPRYAHAPVSGWEWEHGSAARTIHGLTGLLAAGELLDDPGRRQRARDGLRRALAAVAVDADGIGTLRLAGERCGPMADCELLAAATLAGCCDGASVQLNALAARVGAMLRADATIHPGGEPVRAERDNDYLPNAAILALAAHHANEPNGLAARLGPYRAWQLRRFRLLHRWGQAGWIPAACAKVFLATGDAVFAATAFEVADWCLTQQIETTGAFLTDLSDDGPGFHTAFVAEAIADAWEIALACDDGARARRYEAAWRAAMRFARRLVIRPADAPMLADAARSVGGVRGSLTSSLVRIDYASHLAIALAKGLRLATGSAAVAAGFGGTFPPAARRASPARSS